MTLLHYSIRYYIVVINMATIEAPSIEDFKPMSAHSVFGTEYICMQSPDDVGVQLSADGIEAVDQNPALASLLMRMSHFIAENDGYKDPVRVKEAEPGLTLRAASKKADWYGRMSYSSVYHPDAVPEVIIKAFDFNKVIGHAQFHTGAWFHKGLTSRPGEINLYAPMQYALFRAPRSGHLTSVMEYVPGTTLWMGLGELLRQNNNYERSDVEQLGKDIQSSIRTQIGTSLGKLGLILANDIDCQSNIIIGDDEQPLSLDNVLQRTIALIDQPKRRLAEVALYKAASQLSRRKAPIPSQNFSDHR